MPNFRRYYIPDSLVFITSVTHHRYPYLLGENSNDLLKVMNRAKKLHKFDIVAYCILPDHFHWIIDLHDTNGDFSKIMHSVKLNFSRHWRKNNPSSPPRRIWQARFWDHVIRDEKDLSRHIDYIHWNPVKHMIVMQPNAWIASSFQFHLSRGFYDEGWGSNGEPQNIKGLDWE